MKPKSTIWTVWTVALYQWSIATQYLANITRMPSQEYACDFYGSLWFEVNIPGNMSSSMYGNQLTMSLVLPKGTVFTDSNIKILWNNAQTQVLSLGNSQAPLVSSMVTLDQSVSKYILSIVHNNSIICPFSIGLQSAILRITSLFTTDTAVGQTNWTLEGHQGKSGLIKYLKQ